MDENVSATNQTTEDFNPSILDEAAAEAGKKINAEPKPDDAPKPTSVPDKVGDDKANGNLSEEDTRALSDVREGRTIPKHRLDEVLRKLDDTNRRMKAYESLGTPEQVQKKLSQLIEKADDPTRAFSPEDKETYEYLKKVVPELSELNKMRAELNELRKAQTDRMEGEEKAKEENWNRNNAAGSARIRSMAEKIGINVKDPATLTILCKGIDHLISQNPELDRQFHEQGKLEVLDQFFDDYVKRFFTGVQRKASADIFKEKTKQEQLPKPPIPGGTPEAEKAEDPADMDWKDLTKRAMSRLRK